jgi:hypothetical protein
MRGDQLARQRGIIGAVKASPTGLTVAKIGQREETATRPDYRDLKAIQEAWLPLYTEKGERANHFASIGTFKFKNPPPFNLTELMWFCFSRDLNCRALDQDLPRHLVGCRAAELQRRPGAI